MKRPDVVAHLSLVRPDWCRVCGGVCRNRYKVGSDASGWSGKRKDVYEMALSRGIGPTVSGKLSKGERAAPPPGPPFDKCELLAGWLTETAWDNGEERTPGSLLIFAQDLRWKAMLCDKDGDNIAFVTAETFKGLLEALEKGLRNNSLDWRPSRSPAAKRK